MEASPRGRVTGRVRAVLAATLLCGLTTALPAAACRCAPKALADHFADADIVMIATLNAAAPGADEAWVALAFTPVVPAYKGEPEGVSFHTGSSTASCGLPPLVGRQYLIFGRLDPETSALAHVDTCSGSRMFDPRAGALQGFSDVPAEQVPARLATLQGMAALSEVIAASARPKLLGLLDLEPLAHGGHVIVRESPAADAAVLRRIDSMDDLPQREASYEFAAAIVMDRREGWYAIRIDATDTAALGWVSAEEAGTWWPLDELLVRRLTYLTDAWDGLLWPDGAGAGRVLRLAQQAERPVRVIETTQIGGSLWLRVAVLDGSACEGGEPRTTHGGWIPAWAADGRPNAWFYSRGC
jgi:hypothetical protein